MSLSESSHFWRGRSIAIDETGAVSVASGSHPGAPAPVHRACLSDAGVREIDDLLRRHPVRTIVVTRMPAIPDEGSRTLSIVDAQGSHSVSKHIHSEQNASFDALAHWLDHIAGIVEATEG